MLIEEIKTPKKVLNYIKILDSLANYVLPILVTVVTTKNCLNPI